MACCRLDITMLQNFSLREKECFERSYLYFKKYDPRMNLARQNSFIGGNLKFLNHCGCSLVKNSEVSRFSGRIAFALDTGGLPSNDDQDNVNSFSASLGGTRLARIVDAGARQLLEKLNSARKNFPMKVFLLLLGFYTANALATILGQTGDWDVLVAGVVVAAIEGIGALMYRKPPPVPSGRLQSLVMMINYWKAGVCLGLFVDAFKLGS